MAEQDFSEIAKLSERYNKDPKSRIFVQLADAYRKNNMIDESLEILNKGLEHHPNYALAHLILGKCYLDKRMLAQAKNSFEKTLSLDPQNIVALRMLAQTCESTKDEEGQIAAYKGILALDPFDASAKEKLAHLESLQRKEPLYTVSMAEEYEKQGDIAKALSIYEHLLFTDPTDLLLQQKVKKLKESLGEEKKTMEEEKIEGLQVETYFQPEQLEPKPKSTQTEPPKIEETISGKPEVSPPPAEEESKPAQKDEQIAPLKDFLTEKTTEPKSTETSSDEGLDILKPIEAPEEPIPTEESVPAPAEESKPAPQPIQDILPPTPPPETKEEKIAPQPIEEIPTPSPLPEIKEEKPFPEPAETPTPTPAPETKEEKPTPEPVEEGLDLLTPVDVSEAPTSESVKKTEPSPQPAEETVPPTPAPMPEIKEEKPSAESVEEGLDLLTPIEPDQPKEVSSEQAQPSEKPVEEKTEEKKEEPSKPKEEDFKSFQDWLSGLLK